MIRRLTAALIAGVALTACGGGDDSDDQASDDAPTYPSCADVWVVGETLPDGYEGCLEADGTLAYATALPCTDGPDLVSYDDRLWTRADGVIADAGQQGTAAHPDYAVDYRACVG